MKLNSGCLTGFWVSYIHTHRDEGVQIYIYLFYVYSIQRVDVYMCALYERHWCGKYPSTISYSRKFRGYGTTRAFIRSFYNTVFKLVSAYDKL